jgi:methionyl-tRNA formyltransferase
MGELLRVVFLGSGDYSRDLLESLKRDNFEIEAVVTQPDRPAGRGLLMQPTPVKVTALDMGLTVLGPEDLSDKEFIETLKGFEADLLLVADYGRILKRQVLDIPPRGCLNIHPSLLPLYRGAAPIRRALMDGVTVTGVTMMLMDEGLDTGPIVSQAEIDVGEEEDAGELRKELARLAAIVISKDIRRYACGEIAPHPQDESLATYADVITKSELAVDWSQQSRSIHNQVRALSPSPGAYTYYRGKRIKILRTRLKQGREVLESGEIMIGGKDTIITGTGGGHLLVELLQPQGKKVMSAGEFIRGYLHEGEGFTGAP